MAAVEATTKAEVVVAAAAGSRLMIEPPHVTDRHDF